jgi:hypothetical protein
MQQSFHLPIRRQETKTIPVPEDVTTQVSAALAQAQALIRSPASDDGPWDIDISGGENAEGRLSITISITPAEPEPPGPLEVHAKPPVDDDGK